jgi:Mor family transcriptional regulator
MTRHTARRKARIDELTDELCVGAALRLRRDSDEIHEVVRAVVAYLIEEYPAQDLYVPSSVIYPVDEIRADMSVGMSIRAICRKYRMDRRTLYRVVDPTPA